MTANLAARSAIAGARLAGVPLDALVLVCKHRDVAAPSYMRISETFDHTAEWWWGYGRTDTLDLTDDQITEAARLRALGYVPVLFLCVGEKPAIDYEDGIRIEASN